jgi:hypothetical protein
VARPTQFFLSLLDAPPQVGADRFTAHAALRVAVDQVTGASGEEREHARPMGDVVEPQHEEV